MLAETDCEIIVVDRLNSIGDLHRLSSLPNWTKEKHRVRFIWHDLKAEFNSIMLHRIGVVNAIFHFAAGSHVDTSILDPASFVMDNVLGSTHMMMAASKILDPDGLYFDFNTDEVFGPSPEGIAFTEEDRFRPCNPYAASKAGQASMAYAFYKTYGLPVVITHTMNVFGERQHPEKFVPKIIRSILNNEELTIHCQNQDGRMIAGKRTWLYAKNVASALLHLWMTAKPGEIYNIIGPDELDNLQIATKIAALLDKTLHYTMIEGDAVRPGWDVRYNISGDKLLATGWKSPFVFETTLRETVIWTADNRQWIGL